MKILVCSTLFAIIGFTLWRKKPKPIRPRPAAPAKLTTTVFDWTKMTVTPTSNGVRRALFDGADFDGGQAALPHHHAKIPARTAANRAAICRRKSSS